MQTLLQFYPSRWNRQLVWIEEVTSLFLNLCWHSSMSHTCHRYQWVKKWLDAKRGINHIITIGHHNHFGFFIGLRIDFALILLISNMVIHLSFFLVQLFLSGNVRGQVIFALSVKINDILVKSSCVYEFHVYLCHHKYVLHSVVIITGFNMTWYSMLHDIMKGGDRRVTKRKYRNTTGAFTQNS